MKFYKLTSSSKINTLTFISIKSLIPREHKNPNILQNASNIMCLQSSPIRKLQSDFFSNNSQIILINRK